MRTLGDESSALDCSPRKFENADVAQLVARNLAKVQVAGSNPVVRSIYFQYKQFELEKKRTKLKLVLVEWPRGEAGDCKSPYTGSNPVSTSKIE